MRLINVVKALTRGGSILWTEEKSGSWLSTILIDPHRFLLPGLLCTVSSFLLLLWLPRHNERYLER